MVDELENKNKNKINVPTNGTRGIYCSPSLFFLLLNKFMYIFRNIKKPNSVFLRHITISTGLLNLRIEKPFVCNYLMRGCKYFNMQVFAFAYV